jgi:hypothetical protein
MIGKSKIHYDLWGDTLTTSHGYSWKLPSRFFGEYREPNGITWSGGENTKFRKTHSICQKEDFSCVSGGITKLGKT